MTSKDFLPRSWIVYFETCVSGHCLICSLVFQRQLTIFVRIFLKFFQATLATERDHFFLVLGVYRLAHTSDFIA